MNFAQQKERQDMILEPLQVMIQLSLVSHCPLGTKVSISNNILHIQKPTLSQGVVRWWYGDNKDEIPDNIKIFNKVGLAYGFVVDNAYIIDTKNNIEFLLTAVIYSNSNQTMNDDEYDYEKISIPFLASLGRKIYDLELRRFKKMLPDLSLFKNI